MKLLSYHPISIGARHRLSANIAVYVWEKRIANEIDQLLTEIRGGEWVPRYLIPPRIVDELAKFIRNLRNRIEADQLPQQIKRNVALLDLHLTRANMARHRDNIDFLQHVTNALLDVQNIVEWYYRNRNKDSLKEEKQDG